MPLSGYSSRCMALDLDALMTRLGLKSAHLVGHSFGGEVALHLAARRPERVAGFTLADSRVRQLQPTNRLRDWPDWRSVQGDLARVGVFIPEDEREVGHRLLEELAELSQRGTIRTFPPSTGFPVLPVPAMWAGDLRSAGCGCSPPPRRRRTSPQRTGLRGSGSASSAIRCWPSTGIVAGPPTLVHRLRVPGSARRCVDPARAGSYPVA